MGPRLWQAEEDEDHTRYFDTRVFSPNGWRDLHRCHQARHRQGLWDPKAAGHTGISLHEMIYVGDALFPGGNDYPAKEVGVVCVAVRGPQETKPVTAGIVACLGTL